jgi:hypothetical protein
MAFKKDNAAFNHKPREEEIKKKHTDTSMSWIHTILSFG